MTGLTNRLGVWFGALSPNLRGAVFILIGTVFFVANDIVVKLTGDRIHPAQMAVFRYAVGFVLLMPLFLRTGLGKMKTNRVKLHIVRAIIATTGQALVYYAVIHLLLADATAMNFTRPLFLTILAIFILKETVGARRWGATLVGFVGVIVMVRPLGGGFDATWLVALAAAFLFALALIIIRLLSRTDPPATILFWYHIMGVIIFAGPAVYVWVPPTPEEWVQLSLIAVFTATGMFFFVRGFAIGESSVMGTMEYVRLVYAALAGYFIFAEVPDIWTWVGAGIIVTATLYIAQHESRHAKKS